MHYTYFIMKHQMKQRNGIYTMPRIPDHMTFYVFYWIKMFLKFPFADSFSVLFITIQYAVFRKSLRTFCVSLLYYIYCKICVMYIKK